MEFIWEVLSALTNIKPNSYLCSRAPPILSSFHHWNLSISVQPAIWNFIQQMLIFLISLGPLLLITFC